MRDFDVQTVELDAPFDVAFRYLADARTLPEWTHAFRSVANGRATLATPRGAVEVRLEVSASRLLSPGRAGARYPLQLRPARPAGSSRRGRGSAGRAVEGPARGAEGAAEEAGERVTGNVESVDDLVRSARDGDRESLERLVLSIQDRVHGLAIRMLWNPEDARDATQEILIRIVTRLGSFRGASSFTTWVYRVAANYLLTVRKSRLEEERYTFRRFGEELDDGLSDEDVPRPDRVLLLEEVKIGCTLGMLQCLDRPHRIAYVLGEILEMGGDEAARVLGIRPAAFRKRLSRARDAVVAFTRAKCGLVNPAQSCRCRRRLPAALRLGRVTPGRLMFASDAQRAEGFTAVLAEIRRLEVMRRVAALFRTHPPFRAPDDTAASLRKLLGIGAKL